MPPISESQSFETSSTMTDPSSGNDPDLDEAPDISDRVDLMQLQLTKLTGLLAQLLVDKAASAPSTPVASSSAAAVPPPTPTNSRYISEAAGDDYDFLGIDDLLTQPRNQADVKLSGINALSGKDRMDLSVADKNKIWKEAIRGLHPDKFKSNPDLSSGGLESIVSMENILRLDEMLTRLQKYIASFGMLNVFYIVKFDHLDRPLKLDSTSKCILTEYHSIKLYEVEQSVEYFMQYGREYHHENLKWSYDAIMNSCTPELRDALNGKMSVIKEELRTGPMLFMTLMKQLTNVSPQAARLVINKVESLNMSDIEGESIAVVNKTIHAIHKWLNMIRKVPNDFELIVLAIYKTTSIPVFQRFLEAVKLHSMGFGSTMSHEALMETALTFYEDAILEGTWDCSTRSSFNAGASRPQRAPNPLYVAPLANEPEVKDIFGVTHKYCKVCKRWAFGTKAHISSDHVVRKPVATSPTVATPSSSVAPETPRLPRNTEFRKVNFSSGM